MPRRSLSIIVVLLAIWSAGVLAQPVVEGDWIRYETERFFVYLWKDTPLEKLALGSPDPLQAKLDKYQQKTRCYLCAAHVSALPNTPEVQALAATGRLNRYAIYAHLDNTPRGLGGLSIGLPQEVIPHELTHIVDLTLIGGAKPTTLREGLAVYASLKADTVPDDEHSA